MAPGSVAAEFVSEAGEVTPIRIVLEQGVEKLATGQAVYNADRNIARIQRTDVSDPTNGTLRVVSGERFEIVGEPILDTERVEWSCELIEL